MLSIAALPGLLLTSLLPGWLLVRALWPEGRVRDPMSFLRTLVLSMGFSVGITICVASLLGYLPHGQRGFFGPVGIAAGLLAAAAGAFVWGLRRGAFPRLARRTNRAVAPTAEAGTTFAVARR